MTMIERDLVSFTNFAQKAIASGSGDISIDELFDQWRAENPSDALYSENLAAVQAAILDFKNGERGTLVGEHSAQLRQQFGVSGE